MDDVYVAGRRRYLDELKGWRRALLYFWFVRVGRWLYLKLAQPVPVPEEVNGEIRFDSWREGIGVFSTKEEADAAHVDETYFTQQLPFGRSLPDECCQYGYHTFSRSDAARGYVERKLDMVAVERSALVEMARRADAVAQSMKT